MQTLTQAFGGESFIWEMVPGSSGWGSETGKEPIQGVFPKQAIPEGDH